MQKHYWKCILYCFFVGIVISCSSKPNTTKKSHAATSKPVVSKLSQKGLEKKSDLPLTAETAIPFLQRYGAENRENKARIETPLGSFDILLIEQTLYHRANFILLTKQNYIDET